MKTAIFVLAILVISANAEFLKKQSDSLALAQVIPFTFNLITIYL